MNKKQRGNRIISLILSTCIALTMCNGDIVLVFAEDVGSACDAVPELVLQTSEEAEDQDETAEATDETEVTNEPSDYTTEEKEDNNTAEPTDDAAETPCAKLVKKIKAVWIMAGKKNANLRKIAKQTPTGYNVMQGGCSDGEKFAYFSFMKKSTGKVKIVKMELIQNEENPSATEFKYVSCSKVLANISHGNDLAYFKDPLGDGKDKILVVTNGDNGEKTNYVGVFDVESMTLETGKRIRYWNDLSECSNKAYAPDYSGKETRRTMKSLVGDKHGFACIAYEATINRLVAVLKSDHDLAVFRPIWNSNGTVDFKIQRYIRQNKKDKTLQGIDCDENFIYTSWSGVNNKNILQVYDWKGNKVGDRTVTDSFEIENIFHLGTGNGAHFYSGFHYSYWHKYYTEEEVKVKDKKVWKKVKWKKVNGKWKYKWKKVWTYKTKIKKVEHKVIYRDAYCMSLGNLI